MKAAVVTASILDFFSNKRGILKPSWGRTLKTLSWKPGRKPWKHPSILLCWEGLVGRILPSSTPPKPSRATAGAWLSRMKEAKK